MEEKTVVLFDNDDNLQQQDQEEEEECSLIRRPQLRLVDGQYISSQQRHEETIKRYLTVIVNRNDAETNKMPFICHYVSEYDRRNPYDKTCHVTPYTSLLSISEIADYYNNVPSQIEDVTNMSEEKVRDYERLNELDNDVWLNRVPDEVSQKRAKREEKLRAKEKKLIACYVTKEDVQQMDSNEIYRYISYHVRYHDRCVHEISQTLAQLNSPIQRPSDRFIKMVICGTTGIGKSEIVRCIIKLCGMQEGGAYEACKIKLCFHTCLDKSHANIITGSGPAYIGFDQPCLVDRLIKALSFIQTKEAEEANNGNKKKRAKIILIEIQEIDKGTIDIFTTLNEFLDKGILASHRDPDHPFVLPPDVFLLVCASGNFAKDYFSSLSSGDREDDSHDEEGFDLVDAKDEIKRAMLKKGLAECDVSRLGKIFPLFPMSIHNASEILMFKLREFIASDGHYIPRIRMCIQMSQATQEQFVNHMIESSYVKSLGIRQLVERMEDELKYNLTTQREFLAKYLDESLPVPLETRPLLQFQCVQAAKITDMGAIRHIPYLDGRDRSNEANTCKIKDCISQKCDIAYFILTHESIKNQLHGIHVLTPMKKKSSSREKKQTTALNQAKVVKYEKEREEMVMILGDKTTNDYEKVLAMDQVLEPLKLDAEITVVHKRKRDHVEEEEEDFGEKPQKKKKNKKKKIDHVEQQSTGRPRNEYEGFQFYETKSNRSRYQCNKCSVVCDTRAIGKHQCKS